MNDELLLNEPVQVVAVFKSGHHPCMPIQFKRRNGQLIKVSELGLRHPLLKGSRTVHAFDVTDGGTDYRLVFDAQQLTWRLVMEADHYE